MLLADGSEAQLGKKWLSREQLVPFLYRRLYWELNSNPFVGLLEKITSIAGLLADPHLAGGGVHNTSPGGYLRVHADFNKHPQYRLDRRLTCLSISMKTGCPSTAATWSCGRRTWSPASRELPPLPGGVSYSGRLRHRFMGTDRCAPRRPVSPVDSVVLLFQWAARRGRSQGARYPVAGPACLKKG